MKKIFILFSLLCGVSSLFSQNDTLHWSAGKPLTWNDFKGDVPDTATVDGSVEVKILASCKNEAKYSSSNTYVVTVFDWGNSWVKPKMDSDIYLKYFQVMFDIGELYSRKLRKSIKEIKDDPYPVTFNEKCSAAKIGQMDRVKQFKKESKNGAFEAAITRWYDNVKTELTELDAFKQAPVKVSK
ncbi:MAG: hypothetical protein H0W73_19080 [Bacteroidetes bacterium]|nr:hypothetical protein [Bacteroidota bacterium]